MSKGRPKADCKRADGKPKLAFRTRAEAREYRRRTKLRNHVHLEVYVCADHGYHLGHGRELESWE